MNKLTPLFFLLSLSILSCRGPEGPIGPIEKSLTDPAIRPQVIYNYPLNGSQGPYPDFTTRISVRFNKIMDHLSLKHAVKLWSALGDVQFDTTTVTQSSDAFSIGGMDSRGSAFKFRWKLGEQYSLMIDSTAFDVNGNMLAPSFAITFMPEPYFRVTSISPADGATEVAASSTITLNFNSPVDTTIFAKIHISPPISGNWTYVGAFPSPDSTSIRFTYHALLPETHYALTVDAGTGDKYGNSLTQSFSSTFNSLTFRIISSTPTNGSTNVSLFTSIAAGFTIPIDTGTIRSAFSISPDVSGSFRLLDGSSSFTFAPLHRLATNTTYTVALSQSVGAKAGYHLTQPYSFSFITAPFSVSATSPSDGNASVSLTGAIGVTLTDFVDTGSVRGSFSISPPVAGTFVLVDNSQSFQFIPSGGLPGNTSFTVTISQNLHSKTGEGLATPYYFSFLTNAFGVSSTQPSNAAFDQSITAPIQITFNAPIDTTGVYSSITFDPPIIADITTFQGSNNIIFHPLGSLKLNTTYAVTVSTTMKAQSGSYLPYPYTFSFTTLPFKVTGSTPANGEIDAPRSTNITLSFSAPIDTGSVRSALSISPPTQGTLSLINGTSTFHFTPSNLLDANTQYIVSLSTGMRSKDSTNIIAPYVLSFSTGN